MHENEDFIHFIIKIDSMEIFCDKNGIETGIDKIVEEFEACSDAYDFVCRMVDAA